MHQLIYIATWKWYVSPLPHLTGKTLWCMPTPNTAGREARSSSSEDETHVPMWGNVTTHALPIHVENSPSTSVMLVVIVRHSVRSDSLWPRRLQHTRLPYPSPSPRAWSNLYPSSPWCHPTISSSAAPFSSCPQSFPTSGSFPMSQLFASGDQSIGASTSVFPMDIQGWFPLELTGLISLLSKGLLRVFSSTTVQKHQFFGAQPLWSSSHICTWLPEKPQFWLYGPLLTKWCLCFLVCSLGLSQLFFR